jgi:hypothetical protein
MQSKLYLPQWKDGRTVGQCRARILHTPNNGNCQTQRNPAVATCITDRINTFCLTAGIRTRTHSCMLCYDFHAKSLESSVNRSTRYTLREQGRISAESGIFISDVMSRPLIPKSSRIGLQDERLRNWDSVSSRSLRGGRSLGRYSSLADSDYGV